MGDSKETVLVQARVTEKWANDKGVSVIVARHWWKFAIPITVGAVILGVVGRGNEGVTTWPEYALCAYAAVLIVTAAFLCWHRSKRLWKRIKSEPEPVDIDRVLKEFR